MQKRFIKGGRDYLKQHPTVASLKGVRLDLPPFEGSGQGGGKARGGRATSQGGRGRGMAAPIFTVQHMLGESNNTTTEGANECTFEEWENSVNHRDFERIWHFQVSLGSMFLRVEFPTHLGAPRGNRSRPLGRIGLRATG